MLSFSFSQLEMLAGGVLVEARGEAQLTPETVEEGDGLRGGLGGGAEEDFSGCALVGIFGQGVGFGDDGDTLRGAIGATGQVGDGVSRRGRGKDRAGRGHAVEKQKDFQLGFELVGDAVDDEIGIADRVFDGGDKGDGWSLRKTSLRG